MKNVLEEITKLRLERNWSEYELSKYSGVPQSTISTWYRKNQVPTLQNIARICEGMGITLSQFFSDGDDAISLTPEQRELLDNWSALTFEKQQVVKELLRKM